jgi:hypothetical protein
MAFELAGLGEQIGADRQRAERPAAPAPAAQRAQHLALAGKLRRQADADEQDVDRRQSATHSRSSAAGRWTPSPRRRRPRRWSRNRNRGRAGGWPSAPCRSPPPARTSRTCRPAGRRTAGRPAAAPRHWAGPLSERQNHAGAGTMQVPSEFGGVAGRGQKAGGDQRVGHQHGDGHRADAAREPA